MSPPSSHKDASSTPRGFDEVTTPQNHSDQALKPPNVHLNDPLARGKITLNRLFLIQKIPIRNAASFFSRNSGRVISRDPPEVFGVTLGKKRKVPSPLKKRIIYPFLQKWFETPPQHTSQIAAIDHRQEKYPLLYNHRFRVKLAAYTGFKIDLTVT